MSVTDSYTEDGPDIDLRRKSMSKSGKLESFENPTEDPSSHDGANWQQVSHFGYTSLSNFLPKIHPPTVCAGLVPLGCKL